MPTVPLEMNPETKEQQLESKRHRTIRYAASLLVASSAITAGALLGDLWGHHELTDDRQGVAAAEKQLPIDKETEKTVVGKDKLQIFKDQQAVSSFMEQHSKVCQTAIRSYILNGPNRKVSDANANAQVGESGVCPTDGFSAVSDTRAKAKLLTAAESALQSDTIDYQSAVDSDNENLKYSDNFGEDLTIATLGGAAFGGAGFAGVRELLLPAYRKEKRTA